MPIPRSLLVVAALAAVAFAGCGDDGSGGERAAVGGDGSVTIVADRLQFDVETVTAPVGSVEFTLINRDEGIPHNLAITGDGVDESTELEKGPVTQQLTVEFVGPGTYTFVCEIHPAMKGTVEIG
jgi:plastocyanin